MQILKFGGTSVGSVESIQELVKIVQTALSEDASSVVIVSAMSGVTNLLFLTTQEAISGNLSKVQDICAALIEKHSGTVAKLIKNKAEQQRLFHFITTLLGKLKELCYGISILGEAPPRVLEVVASMGEMLSAQIVAAALSKNGIPSEAVNATELIVTDSNFGNATPDLKATTKKTSLRLCPMILKKIIPVVTGFIGATPEGITTTLGRGGSDYSAGIIGKALSADRVIIWTDVNGFLTADPNIVKDAQTIPQISYSEAAELSYYGAKVLHPKTLLPLVLSKIPIHIKNSFFPSHPGTIISFESRQWNAAIKAITSIKNISLITVSGKGMMGLPGIAAKSFSTVAIQNINVLMISQSSSENNLCFVVEASDAERTVSSLHKSLELEFHHQYIETISIRNDVAVIAVVGGKMQGSPGIAAKIFSAVADCNINVIAIAQGSSELNISFIIAESDVRKAVIAIHQSFDLGNIQ